jgi:hypothetical protein
MWNDIWQEVAQAWRVQGDVIAASISVAAFYEYLPPIAVVLTIIYTALRIWESKTVQGLLGKKSPPPEE